ncbi:heat shock 70 kDa protein-like isoform X2 [Zophobas morio]|uniref:heat shock 70 kDa protein-like isoform X2 n=1 Tax=Zophobas morio TaxID=2755281 RepID=UPI0030826E49
MPPVLVLKVGNFNSYSGIVKEEGTYKIIENSFGERSTPSYIAFTEYQVEVGSLAKQNYISNPSNTVFGFNRLLSNKISDFSPSELKRWQCRICRNKDFDENAIEDGTLVEVTYLTEKKIFSPSELITIFLKELKLTAETSLSLKLSKAIVVMPSYFVEDTQQKLFEEIVKNSGITALRFIKEPVSACLAFDLVEDALVIVLDYGALGVTCSLVRISCGLYTLVKTEVDNSLGTAILTARLMQFFASQFFKSTKLNISENLKAVLKLRAECERALIALTRAKTYTASVEALMEGIDLNCTIDRGTFEQLCKTQLEDGLKPLRSLLTNSEIPLGPQEVTHVVFTGGGANIPLLQELLKQEFESARFLCGSNPEETVVIGGLKEASLLLKFKGSLNLEVQPTEVYALSHTLSLEISGGRCYPILKRMTPLPAHQKVVHRIACDVLLKVYEGECSTVEGNKLLKEIPVMGINSEQMVSINFHCSQSGVLRIAVESSVSGMQICEAYIP